MSPPTGPIGPGTVIAGRYEIVGTLGAGGMATVYKALDRALEVNVALKILKESRTSNPELAQRFKSEIKLARLVRHRNVCGIHEYGEDGDLLFITMELVEGKDLRCLLRERTFAWEEVFDVAIQIAEGLVAIHEVGIIHRDLKPANITRDERGLVRVMDFGIAKVWGADSAGATGTGHAVGSPAYMSPEQVRGGSLDFRSDIYALGLVIYELFTGTVPFRGDTPADAMVRRLETEPDWDSPAARRIPSSALPILHKALEREPAARYSSCGDLLEDLRAARAGLDRQVTDPEGTSAPDTPSGAPGPAAPQVPIFSRAAQARLLVPPLVRATRHADRGVRLGAVEALGRLVEDDLLAGPLSRQTALALDEAERDEDDRVRKASAALRGGLEHKKTRTAPTPTPAPSTPKPSGDGVPRPAPKPYTAPAPPVLPPQPVRARRLPIELLVVVVAGGLATKWWVEWRKGHLPPDVPPVSVTLPPSTMASESPPSSTVPSSPSPPTTNPPPATSPPPTTIPPPPATTTPPVVIQPSPSLQPTPSPEPSASSPEPISPPPTTTATLATPPPAVIVPASCLSCDVPETVNVLAHRLDLSRTVRLGLHVSETGDVLRVDYLEGAAPLKDTITRAAMRWRYRPARRDSTPVPSYVKVDVKLE